MVPIKPGTAETQLKLQVACMSRAGKEPGFKKTNQDNCFAFEKYITEDQSLFGAMDGHGPHGHLVSGYLKQHLPIILVNHLTNESKSVEDALTSGFLEVDKGLGNSRIDCEFSGSTCVVGYIQGKTLTTAWVGDSRGVIGYDAGAGIQPLDLTNDHKPTLPEEKERILKSNGRVEKLVDEVGQPMGPHRVWLQYAWIPGLAMSRALGDVLAHQVGVSSEPEHTVIDLDPTHKFMILASDGVWEFITSKEAVDIVAQYETVEEACRQLVDEAYQRWLTEEEGVVDDITAVIVKFHHD
jgi:serine/threonine protein phosphatase PrpC